MNYSNIKILRFTLLTCKFYNPFFISFESNTREATRWQILLQISSHCIETSPHRYFLKFCWASWKWNKSNSDIKWKRLKDLSRELISYFYSFSVTASLFIFILSSSNPYPNSCRCKKIGVWFQNGHRFLNTWNKIIHQVKIYK